MSRRKRPRAVATPGKNRRWPPQVMEHLMRQAQEEDRRRDAMSEMDRDALMHLRDM